MGLYHQIKKGQLLFLFSPWGKTIFSWFRLKRWGVIFRERVRHVFFWGQETGIIFLSKSLQKLWRHLTADTEEMKADSKQVIEDVYFAESLMLVVMSSCLWGYGVLGSHRKQDGSGNLENTPYFLRINFGRPFLQPGVSLVIGWAY